MEVKDGLKYTKSHEWVRVEGQIAYIGITDYAQESLGDIVYVELPAAGTKVARGDEILNIESVKVAEAVYTPVGGTVFDVNNNLQDQPEAINQDPYGTFIYALEMQASSELEDCMDASEYKKFVESS